MTRQKVGNLPGHRNDVPNLARQRHDNLQRYLREIREWQEIHEIAIMFSQTMKLMIAEDATLSSVLKRPTFK